MDNNILMHVMLFYGLFLISCGIVSIAFIGFKAKTALLSGGMSGGISLLIAYGIFHKVQGIQIAGMIFTFALFSVFSWRSAKTLFRLFEMIPLVHEGLKHKGIAFLIISLMAVISFIVFGFQFILML